MKKLLLLLSVLLLMTSCGKKSKGFSADELQKIHDNEALLREKLVNKTWHYYDEPVRAVRYLDDGSYENYFGPGISGRDYFTGDDGMWEVKYCESLNGDTSLLETDRERAEKYYDYNVLVTYVNSEGNTKTYTLSLEFAGDDLLLGGDKLFEGESIIERMPEGLGIFKDLPGHIWYIDGMGSYALFFDDGYCYMTYGVFLDGSTNGSYIYRWGYDENQGLFYLMDHYDVDGKICEDIKSYAINGVNGDNAEISLELVDTWSNGAYIMNLAKVDGQDDSAKALLHSYEQLHSWTIENWKKLYE